MYSLAAAPPEKYSLPEDQHLEALELVQWLSTGGVLLPLIPRGYLAMSGNTFGFHN